jgi:hypothetical protein
MYSAQKCNLLSAYGGFLSQWPWDHYATLTFGRHLSDSRCLKHWDAFIDSLGRLTRGRVAWVRADEKRWSGYASPGIPRHFHSLLKYQHVPEPEAVAALWKSRAGDAQVEAYRSGGGAAHYVAKMFPCEDSQFDMGGLEHFPRSGDFPIRGSSN